MPGRSPLNFFLLVFALSIPFWLIGGLTSVRLLPGLPLSSLMVVCPLLAASLLVYGESGKPGVAALLKRALDYRQIRQTAWYIPILLLMPVVMLVTWAVMRLLGLPLPTVQFPLLPALGMFAAFLLAAVGEEVGWSGYVIDPLQDRWNALQASLVVGLVSVAWHMVPLLQAQRAPEWIAGWTLNAVALRVLTVWLYNSTGKSLFAAILFHTMVNLSTFLFPNYASHWDPRISGLITALVATGVVIIRGPKTLAARTVT